MSVKLSLVGILGVVVLLAPAQAAPPFSSDEQGWHEVLDWTAEDFMADTGLTGATFGILQDDQLMYATGKGHIRGHSATPSSLLPILGLSKLITAVAVLQLIEKGEIDLTDRVFGKQGILYYIKPEFPNQMDSRLHHITVENLLQHTAGFDETIGPVYDPMLNAMFIKRGYNVVDIMKEMNLFGIPNQDDIIHFMVGRPLPNKPGTKVLHSNFGYCVLGRIIEEVTGLSYEEYVREKILLPAGMWHTRMGPQPADTYQNLKYKNPESFYNMVGYDTSKKGYIPLGDDGVKSLFDSIPAGILDSTLGWHSNVYDMARFYTALFKRGKQGLLKPQTTEILFLPATLTNPTTLDDNHYEGLCMTVDPEGTYWHMSTNFDVGINVFMYHQPSTSGFMEYFGESSDGRSTDLTLFFFGVSTMTKETLKELAQSILQPTLLPSVPYQGYMSELADTHMVVSDTEVAIKYAVSEHKLPIYASAMRIAGFYPTWLHGYIIGSESHLITIFERAMDPLQLDYDVSIHTNKDKTTSYCLNKGTKEGYQLALLQSYHSGARAGQMGHITVMTKYHIPNVVKFDIDTDLDDYLTAQTDGLQEGFIPTVQSVDVINDEPVITYLLSQPKDEHGEVIYRRYKSYHDLSLQELEDVVKDNAARNFNLVYLDSHVNPLGARFSAIFHEDTILDWLLQTDLKVDSMNKEAKKWQDLGYVLKLLVAYPTDHGNTKFVGFWVSPIPQ